MTVKKVKMFFASTPQLWGSPTSTLPGYSQANQIIDRKSLRTTEEIKFYIKTTPLRQLLDDLKSINVSISQLADLSGIPMKRIGRTCQRRLGGYNPQSDRPFKTFVPFLIRKVFSLNTKPLTARGFFYF